MHSELFWGNSHYRKVQSELCEWDSSVPGDMDSTVRGHDSLLKSLVRTRGDTCFTSYICIHPGAELYAEYSTSPEDCTECMDQYQEGGSTRCVLHGQVQKSAIRTMLSACIGGRGHKESASSLEARSMNPEATTSTQAPGSRSVVWLGPYSSVR